MRLMTLNSPGTSLHAQACPISNRWSCCFLLPGQQLPPLPKITRTGLLVLSWRKGSDREGWPPPSTIHCILCSWGLKQQNSSSVETSSFANIPALWATLSSSAWCSLAGVQPLRCCHSQTQVSCLSFVWAVFYHQRRGSSLRGFLWQALVWDGGEAGYFILRAHTNL